MGSLSALGRIHERNLVIDAGCGSGIQSRILTSNMKSESALYAFDFSAKMIECFEHEFKSFEDFNANPKNYFEKIDISTLKGKLSYINLYTNLYTRATIKL